MLRKTLQEGAEPDHGAGPHAVLTFEEILVPVHRQAAESGTTDEELDGLWIAGLRIVV
jgi:hypothetical protein